MGTKKTFRRMRAMRFKAEVKRNKQCRQVLKKILDTLGFIYTRNKFKEFVLYSKDVWAKIEQENKEDQLYYIYDIVILTSTGPNGFYGPRSISEFITSLFNEITGFQVPQITKDIDHPFYSGPDGKAPWTTVTNPFYGCKSYEEALLRSEML